VDSLFETSITLRSKVRVLRAEPTAPLVIALHGWGMNTRTFARWLRPGVEQGGASWWLPRGILPCEVTSPPKRRIGYAWYVFDGDQDALRASMDEAMAYLTSLVTMAREALRPSSVALLGFSQGAYLSSYVALSRPDLFDTLVCCGGRPKAEFIDDLEAAKSVRVLIQSGSEDTSVTPELIQKGVQPLIDAGLNVDSRSYDAGHRLTTEMAEEAAGFVLAA